MKVYVNQSNLTLSLITNNTLTDVSSALIKYTRPDGTQGQWTGTVNGTLVEYAFQNGDLYASGTWVVWVYITFTSGKISIGEPSDLVVNEQGT